MQLAAQQVTLAYPGSQRLNQGAGADQCVVVLLHASYITEGFFTRCNVINAARTQAVFKRIEEQLFEFGGGDFAPDRILPDSVCAAMKRELLFVRNPNSTRPYQHVLEPVFAYLMIAQRQWEEPELAGWYNVGPDDCDCVTTGELADLFCASWGEGHSWETRAERGPHEANFLKLDCAKLKSTMGWCPRWHIAHAVEKTVEWTRVWLSGGDTVACMQKQIQEYLED